MTQPVRVDIVSDVVCPWCLIGWRQLARASQETGVPVEVHWHPFELNPDMPPEGENLRDHVARKYGSTPAQSSGARARIVEMGAALGFDFAYGPETRMRNTFLAHQLIDWAETQGMAHETKQALFESFFTRGEDVSDLETLVAVAGRVGLDPAAARGALERGERAALVREKQAFWTERGISGVPAMIFDRRRMVPGAQGEETFAAILRRQAAAAAV
ncbi:DsbA family oxidoreductase [uncultured Albimonas sp.]|uniref:DsbA family oxidoreductase n=1 Tax=uncultured Albimonas sp. TaxID=1331701 RepID=UPI0030ED9EA3